MTFLSPSRLWLLAAVGALAVLYVVLQRRRRHHAVRFTNLELLDAIAPRRPGWRRHLSAAVVGLALTTLVVSLARPARSERVPRDEGVVMLAIDTSASMTATDVAPSRIAAATQAAVDFVENMPGEIEVGLVAFDETARVLATPNADHDAVVAAIERLAPGRGTAGGEGLYAALDAIAAARDDDTRSASTPSDATATVVLLSDGTTTAGRRIEEAAQAAAAQNVPVTTIAYGTDSGTVEVQGEVVPVPADTETMAAVAETTGGSAFVAASAQELQAVYDDIEGRVGFDTETREIGRFFVAVGLLALFVAVAASMVWNARFL